MAEERGSGRRSDIPFYSSALSALRRRVPTTWASPAQGCRGGRRHARRRARKRTRGDMRDSAEAAARVSETPVSSIALRGRTGRLRARQPLTFETRILGRSMEPTGCTAGGAGCLVGPSDTATCRSLSLGGSQEDNRGECWTPAAHDDERGSRYRRLLLHHVHAARRLAQDGYLLKICDPAMGRLGVALILTTFGTVNRIGSAE